MNTLNGPSWSRCSIAPTYPPDHISSAHYTGKDGTRFEMNVAAHQESEKNKETKTGKRKAGEGR